MNICGPGRFLRGDFVKSLLLIVYPAVIFSSVLPNSVHRIQKPVFKISHFMLSKMCLAPLKSRKFCTFSTAFSTSGSNSSCEYPVYQKYFMRDFVDSAYFNVFAGELLFISLLLIFYLFVIIV